jgi:glyoxylase-like metal-dependent hydrolase (beta-lactamase superfamily II)
VNHAHRVYAIKYGRLERKARTNFINPPGDHEADMPMDYFLWLILCDSGRKIVVDTGYSARVAEQRGRTMLRHPAVGLARMGVDPALVEDVVITHLHYDHAGNVDAFPGARFWLQESEMQFTTGKYMCHDFFRLAYEREDIVAKVNALFANRLKLVDGDIEMEPGVSLHHVGGHTAGLQMVRVETEAGPVVLASDLCHYYANLELAQPFPIVYSPTQLMDSFARAKSFVKDGGWLVPGHDPLVMQRFRAEPDDPEFTVRLWEPAA